MTHGLSATFAGAELEYKTPTQKRFNPREGLNYGEWVRRRDQEALNKLRYELNQGYHRLGETLTRMAGIGYNSADPDQKVEEALAILREQNPLGGPWISLAQDYRRMRQTERSLSR